MTDPRLEQIAAECRSGNMDRRIFIKRLVAVLGSYPLALHFLETSGWARSLLSPQESLTAGLDSTAIKYPGEGATLQGYLSRPKTGGPRSAPSSEQPGTGGAGPADRGGPFPGVILIHENRGLNEHIRDVARRIAAQGFVTLAVDHLSRKGGTASFATPEEATAAFESLPDEQVLLDLDAAYEDLTSHRAARRDRIAVCGFGWGGRRSFLYATDNPALKAAVVFYGSPPPEEKLPDIQCPVLGNYGEADIRITAMVPNVEETMKRLGKSYDPKVYPGAAHAFFNDTNRERYNESAAQDAWTRSIAFLRKNLG